MQAGYQFDDVDYLRQNIIALRNDIANRLLGEGPGSNVFTAIKDVKDQITSLLKDSNEDLA